MTRALLSSLLLSLAVASGASAQAPVIEKVDPPNWWAGHTINPVRLLIRGQHLDGARFDCPRLACANVKVSARGTYAFVDVTVPAAAKPGGYPLTLRTSSGSATVPFTVHAPLATNGRFAGFGAKDVIYLIMPDRFANGDPSNDRGASAETFDRAQPRRYHGGDLAGVSQKLPYLKSLGVSAIWLNPIFDNTNSLDTKEVYDGQPTTAYHGYHAIDYYGVEEHFGDLATFKKLVDDAHAQGIKMIVDMVANHTSAYHPWVQDSPTPTWYNGTPAQHLANVWQTWTIPDPYSTPAVRKSTLDGWFVDILPDLNQNDPEVSRYLIQNTLWWIGVSGIDGIRQDTWQYVPRTFWRDWMAAIKKQYPKFTVVGEVLDGDPAHVSFFEGNKPHWDGVDDKLDALFDFPLFYAIRDAFARGRSIRAVPAMLAHDRLYAHPSSLVTLLGLHDVNRFMGEEGATTDGLQLAFTFLLTSRGTPMLYYGDEIGLPGGGDPDNRREFPGGWSGDAHDAFTAAGRSPTEQAVWSHVQTLLKLRASRPELRAASTTNLFSSEQQWVYRRGATVVALNNDTKAAEVRMPWMSLRSDALGKCSTRRDGGDVVISIPSRTGCVF